MPESKCSKPASTLTGACELLTILQALPPEGSLPATPNLVLEETYKTLRSHFDQSSSPTRGKNFAGLILSKHRVEKSDGNVEYSSTTGPTLTLVTEETFIPTPAVLFGLIFLGLEMRKRIEKSLMKISTVTIPVEICLNAVDTARIIMVQLSQWPDISKSL
jgi:hypothetical protein